MASRLKQETLKVIEDNANDLYGPLAKAMGIDAGSLKMYVSRNSRRFTEYLPLKVIADYTGKTPDELIEEYDDSTETAKVDTAA